MSAARKDSYFVLFLPSKSLYLFFPFFFFGLIAVARTLLVQIWRKVMTRNILALYLVFVGKLLVSHY